MVNLLQHDVSATYGSPEYPFIQDQPKSRWFFSCQDLLTLQPGCHSFLDILGVKSESGLKNRTGVIFRLKKSWHNHWLE